MTGAFVRVQLLSLVAGRWSLLLLGAFPCLLCDHRVTEGWQSGRMRRS